MDVRAGQDFIAKMQAAPTASRLSRLKEANKSDHEIGHSASTASVDSVTLLKGLLAL